MHTYTLSGLSKVTLPPNLDDLRFTLNPRYVMHEHIPGCRYIRMVLIYCRDNFFDLSCYIN